MVELDTNIQFRVTSARKERWKQEVDNNSRYAGMTDLIKTSVERELADTPQEGGAAELDLAEVHDRFDAVSKQLHDIEDRLDETYFLVRGDEDDYTEITARIHDLIPDVEGSSGRNSLLGEDVPPADSEEDPDSAAVATRTGSVKHIVRHLQNTEDYAPLDVKNAVERLAANSSTVELGYGRPQEREDMRVYRRTD